MKLGFKTIEELQNNYPIGSIVKEYDNEISCNLTIHCKADFDFLKTKYYKIEKVPKTENEYIGFSKFHYVHQVEGYIYDGEFWYPASNTWEGWVPYYDTDDF